VLLLIAAALLGVLIGACCIQAMDLPSAGAVPVRRAAPFCAARTQGGVPCRNRTWDGSGLCHWHRPLLGPRPVALPI
jgi:hypothetical protein